MDIIFEVIVEFFAEIFCEGVLSASTEIVPYDKLPRDKREKYKFIVVLISVILLILLVIGGVMLLETKGKSERRIKTHEEIFIYHAYRCYDINSIHSMQLIKDRRTQR